MITSAVLIGYGASESTISLIAWWNNWVDRPGNLFGNEEHGMRNIGQDITSAIRANKEFRDAQLRMAIQSASRCEYDRAFSHLGQGLHAVQDAVAHDFITLAEHLVTQLVSRVYRDKWPTEEKIDRATKASGAYVEQFVNRLGCNPFKDKGSVISSNSPCVNRNCCCE